MNKDKLSITTIQEISQTQKCLADILYPEWEAMLGREDKEIAREIVEDEINRDYALDSKI